MRLHHWLWPGAAVLVLAASGVLAQEPAAPAVPAAPVAEAPAQITEAILEGYVTKLASDEFKGRDVKSGGVELAAEYLIAQMKAAGLEPGGDDGTFSHAFTLGRISSPAEEQLLAAGGESIMPGKGWMLLGPCAGTWGGPLTYGGDGSAETLAAVSDEQMKGAALIVQLSGALFEPSASAGLREIATRAQARGASVVIGLAGRDLPDRMWGGFALRRMASRSGTEADIVTPKSEGAIPIVWCEQRGLAALLGPKAAGAIGTHSAGDRVKSRANDEVPEEALQLALTATAAFSDPVRYRNVIGRITGTDAELKSEALVLSAHYDHIGMHPNENLPDRIFNGADDDASGTAAILAMGAAFAKDPPKRTVLVIAFTAEEKGLLGSKHYVQHPTVPLKQIVADVNVEMIGRPAASGPGTMWITGYERSSFGPIFTLAAAAAGVKAVKDPYAMMGFFRRSDNYSFANAGIPGHTCSSYNARGARYYHQPNDHAADCDFANMAKLVHGIYLGARVIAMGEATPQWVEGDPLASKR